MASMDGIETYKPSGKCTAKGLTVMVGLGLAGTILACLVAFVVTYLTGGFIDLGPVLAIFLGLVTGAAVWKGVQIGKCRQPLAAGIIGLGLGLSGYLLLHYLNYSSRVHSFHRTVEKRLHADSSDIVGAQVALLMEQAWGRRGFSGYLIGWRKGIRRLVWFIEIAIVAGLATAIPFHACRDPFCEECGDWCDRSTVLVAALDMREKILDACSPEGVARIKGIEPVEGGISRCVADLDFCRKCRKTGFLTVTTVEAVGAGRTIEKEIVSEAVVSGDELWKIIPDEKAEVPRGRGIEPLKLIPEDEIHRFAVGPGESNGGQTSVAACKDDREEKAEGGRLEEHTSEGPAKDGLDNGQV